MERIQGTSGSCGDGAASTKLKTPATNTFLLQITLTDIPQIHNHTACYPPSQIAQLRPSPQWTAHGTGLFLPVQNMSSATCPAAPRSPYSIISPAFSQIAQIVSTVLLTHKHRVLQLLCSYSCTPYSSTVYAAGVYGPQQRLNAQPQISMQQPAIHAHCQESLLLCWHLPLRSAKANLGEYLLPLIQATHPTLVG